MFDTLTVDEVAGLIKLHVALGKCLATIYDVAGSVLSYEAALEVWFVYRDLSVCSPSFAQCSTTLL
jgi:hypothetical protein